jgi:predicted MFS family arabinose efflux permease
MAPDDGHEDHRAGAGTATVMTPAMVALFAVACGVSVASLYYAQPLLPEISRGFTVGSGTAGLIVTAAQIGYGIGLALIVPLGDILIRRRLIPGILVLAALALVAASAAPDIDFLIAAVAVAGVCSVSAQILVPFAASLASDDQRGRVVGTVMSGLLIGILAARTVSGLVGEYVGWRAMYGIAAVLMVALALALKELLPRSEPEHSGMSYLGLLRSIGGLLRDEPVLRQSCLFGAMGFGAFSAFWTTLAFHLAGPPFGYPIGVVGLFGLVGVVGALAAPLAGRFADRRSARWAIGAGLTCVLLAYVVLYGAGGTLWGLVAGVILLDLGVQSAHISNQSRIYAIRPKARTRMNTAYMVASFVGGAAGSYAGAWGWGLAGWGGVCLVGLGMTALGLLAFAATAAGPSAPAVAPGGEASLECRGSDLGSWRGDRR